MNCTQNWNCFLYGFALEQIEQTDKMEDIPHSVHLYILQLYKLCPFLLQIIW